MSLIILLFLKMLKSFFFLILRRIISTDVYDTCYLLTDLYFFFWDITQHYHEMLVNHLVAVVDVVNGFSHILRLLCHFNVFQ